MDLYPHKSGLGLMEPVAQINHNVGILHGNKWKYWRVTYLESIPPFQFLNIGAVAAKAISTKTNAVNLELEENEFGQFRWYPLDNAQVRLWLPSADGRYRLKNLMSVVDTLILDRDPDLHLTEFFEWEDSTPHFEAINYTDYALTQMRLIAQGFRFKVEALSSDMVAAIASGKEACTRIVCQGIA